MWETEEKGKFDMGLGVICIEIVEKGHICGFAELLVAFSRGKSRRHCCSTLPADFVMK
jgi:hypothetical protein